MEDMVTKAFSGIYKGKKVLVTGHTGFKGSWLSFWLHILGARVIGYSLYMPSDPSNFAVLKLRENIYDIEGDIRDIDKLQHVFNTYNPEIIFHLAAQPIVRRSYDEPKITFDTNFGGTVNILESVRKTSSVEAVVMVTSDKCYENLLWDYGYREIDRLGGSDPYSASKACAELAVSSYARSFFTGNNCPRIATVRAGNVIGGGDWAEDRIVPDCIKAWAKGERTVLRNPKATRPWQHVLEPISGYLLLCSNLFNNNHLSGESFNFGPAADASNTVESLVRKMAAAWGNPEWEVLPDVKNKQEHKFLKLCCDKALLQLGWKAVFNSEETITETIRWYRNFYNGRDMRDFSFKQIKYFCEKAKKSGLIWMK